MKRILIEMPDQHKSYTPIKRFIYGPIQCVLQYTSGLHYHVLSLVVSTTSNSTSRIHSGFSKRGIFLPNHLLDHNF